MDRSKAILTKKYKKCPIGTEVGVGTHFDQATFNKLEKKGYFDTTKEETTKEKTKKKDLKMNN